MEMKQRFAAVVLVLCGAACSSSSGGSDGTSGPVKGNVAGNSFSAVDTVSLVGSVMVSGATGYEADVVVSTSAGTCTGLMQSTENANSALLIVAVASATPVTPGTYSISPTGMAQVRYDAVGAACSISVQEEAQSGTVVYTTIDASSIVGTIDAVFPNGDHISGAFTAPLCNQNLSVLVSAATVTCNP
jgi:hypothetical protein